MKAELVPVNQRNIQITMTPAQAHTLLFIAAHSLSIPTHITNGQLLPLHENYSACRDVLSAIHSVLAEIVVG